MNWNFLAEESQLNGLIDKSYARPQLIYKHSTRCNISSIALNRLQKGPFPESIDFYLLDLLANRSLSNKVAEKLHVHHESPQVILVYKGEAVYDESHLSIGMDEIIEQAGQLQS